MEGIAPQIFAPDQKEFMNPELIGDNWRKTQDLRQKIQTPWFGHG